MTELETQKYFVKVDGKWKMVDRDEANKLMGIKVRKDEFQVSTSQNSKERRGFEETGRSNSRELLKESVTSGQTPQS